jgi:hypothetical protein
MKHFLRRSEMDMIEKLKKNKTAFGLLFNDEREGFEKAGTENCLYYDGKNFIQPKRKGFSSECTYAINPDYQPEPPKPEFVDLEIVKHAEDQEQPWWIGVWYCPSGERYEFLPHEFTHLHCLPSLPGFEGFFLKNSEYKDTEVDYQRVARCMPNVIARFKV